MTERFVDTGVLVLGIAAIIGGFIGRDLRNDVEMPLTDEELADKRPTGINARIIYILFGLGMAIWGFFRLYVD